MEARTAPLHVANRRATRSVGDVANTNSSGERSDYVTPVFQVHLPERVVEAGFWGALVGAAALGAVDPPLALLIGGAVLVVRHRARTRN